MNIENISDYDRKIKLINDFTDDALCDKDTVKLDQNRMRNFLSAYIEISEIEPIQLNARIAFIQSLLGSPDYAYKNVNLVTANFFINEFDKAVNEIKNNKLQFVLTILNCDLSGKALSEWAEGGANTIKEANWDAICLHVHDIAQKMGWDENYND